MYKATKSFAMNKDDYENIDIKKGEILSENFASQEIIEELLEVGHIVEYDSSLEITENGIYDVKDYENADVNVSSGGSSGNSFSFYNDGTLTPNYLNGGINVIVENDVPAYGFGSTSNQSNIREVYLKEGVKEIGEGGFSYCQRLTIKDGKIPNSLKKIGTSGFASCYNLNIEKLPQVTEIFFTGFKGCISFKKISMPMVINIWGNGSNTGAFFGCSKLKQVWIGSSIEVIGRYVFTNCNVLEKIYINLPRGTVEKMAGYQYAFMNDTTKTGIIVCNDDEGFITENEFDALVVE